MQHVLICDCLLSLNIMLVKLIHKNIRSLFSMLYSTSIYNSFYLISCWYVGNFWKWKSLGCVWLFAIPWTMQPIEFFRPEYWNGLRFPSPGDLPNPGIKPRSFALQVDTLPAEPQGQPKNTGVGSLSLLQWIFPTQESNLGLLHCRRILYQLSYQGSPGQFLVEGY